MEDSTSNDVELEENEVNEPILVCKCLRDDTSSVSKEFSERKRKILSIGTRTEQYLRERRIDDLMHFFVTKILADQPDKPAMFLSNLLDECMLFRRGLGRAPVLYERSHLEAVVKSFDPGDRGWLSSGQIHRCFTSLGLKPMKIREERVPTAFVLQELVNAQEKELYNLICAGSEFENVSVCSSSTSGNHA